MVDNEGKQLICRKMIELYPSMIGMQLSQFDSQIQQHVKEVRENYEEKYKGYYVN